MLPNLFDGCKTYVAAAGLIGLALYQLSQGDVHAALQTFLAGLAALGLRHAIAKAGATAAVILLFLCLPHAAQAQEVSKPVLDRIRTVSVSIEVDGELAGSGTLFDRDGETWCITARHVLQSGKSVRVSQYQPNKSLSVYAEVFKQDDKHDVALLKLGKGVFGPGVPFCKCKKPRLDTPLVHCGSMAGHHHTVTRGYLVGLDQEFRPGIFADLCDFTAHPGSSGGGVFTTSGQFVGLVSAGIGSRLIYIVPLRTIEETLK